MWRRRESRSCPAIRDSAALSWIAAAHAEDRYVFVGSARDVAIFLDIDDIVINGHSAIATSLQVTREPPGSYTIEKNLYDCQNYTDSVISESDYAADGTVVGRSGSGTVAPIVAGSIGENFAALVCGKKAIDPNLTFASMALARRRAQIVLQSGAPGEESGHSP